MKSAATLSATILLLTCSTASAERMQEYSAPDYGFSFQAPVRLQTSTPGTADHGWSMFLDHHTRHPEYISDRRRYISVFAEAHWDGHDRKGLLADYCKDGKGTDAPEGLTFAHAQSSACRESKNGWTDIWVISIDGTGGNTVDHFARLHTNAPHFAADFELFRSVVKSVRIFSPP
jgi:hypothetical protein